MLVSNHLWSFSQCNHTRFDTYGLQLRSIHLICRSSQFLKINFGTDLHLSRVNSIINYRGLAKATADEWDQRTPWFVLAPLQLAEGIRSFDQVVPNEVKLDPKYRFDSSPQWPFRCEDSSVLAQIHNGTRFTLILSSLPNPSNWFNNSNIVLCTSRSPDLSLSKRFVPIASSSSMKMIVGAFSLARAKASRTSRAPSPINIWTFVSCD